MILTRQNRLWVISVCVNIYTIFLYWCAILLTIMHFHSRLPFFRLGVLPPTRLWRWTENHSFEWRQRLILPMSSTWPSLNWRLYKKLTCKESCLSFYVRNIQSLKWGIQRSLKSAGFYSCLFCFYSVGCITASLDTRSHVEWSIEKLKLQLKRCHSGDLRLVICGRWDLKLLLLPVTTKASKSFFCAKDAILQTVMLLTHQSRIKLWEDLSSEARAFYILKLSRICIDMGNGMFTREMLWHSKQLSHQCKKSETKFCVAVALMISE